MKNCFFFGRGLWYIEESVAAVDKTPVHEGLVGQPPSRKLRHWPPGMDKTPFMPPFFLIEAFDRTLPAPNAPSLHRSTPRQAHQ
jgi:hypothetical protein